MASDPQRPRLIHLFVSVLLGPTNFFELEGSLSELGNEGLFNDPQMDMSLVRAVVPVL